MWAYVKPVKGRYRPYSSCSNHSLTGTCVHYSLWLVYAHRFILDWMDNCIGSLAAVRIWGSDTIAVASLMVGMATGSLVISAGVLGLGIMCTNPLWMNTCVCVCACVCVCVCVCALWQNSSMLVASSVHKHSQLFSLLVAYTTVTKNGYLSPAKKTKTKKKTLTTFMATKKCNSKNVPRHRSLYNCVQKSSDQPPRFNPSPMYKHLYQLKSSHVFSANDYTYIIHVHCSDYLAIANSHGNHAPFDPPTRLYTVWWHSLYSGPTSLKSTYDLIVYRSTRND